MTAGAAHQSSWRLSTTPLCWQESAAWWSGTGDSSLPELMHLCSSPDIAVDPTWCWKLFTRSVSCASLCCWVPVGMACSVCSSSSTQELSWRTSGVRNAQETC